MSEFNLLMANGSILGDIQGKFTCCAWNGMSTNDLFLFERKLSSRINYFKVNDSFDWFSDHKSVSFSIRVNVFFQKNSGSWSMETVAETKFKMESG